MEKTTRKSLLYKSGVEYSDFCINHVEGCSHGCTFPCYAFLMAKRFGKVKSYDEWVKPKLVENALELLEKEIPRYKDQIKFVHLCFATDPFMYKQGEVADVSLKIIERLNKDRIKCTVLTKGKYPKELINQEKYGFNNEYGITLVSLNEDFRQRFEPGSAPYAKRVDALKHLHDNGLNTWVSIEPYPTPNLVHQDLEKIINAVSFADKIVFGRLNYSSLATHFNGAADFYDECAKIVSSFCKEKSIKHHIKFGTQKKPDKKSAEKIFSDKFK